MCTRNDRMMRLAAVLVMVGSLSSVEAAERRAMHAGDVTITATSEANAPCDECPDGVGTRICYEVVLDASAENENATDFHIKVSDGNASHYKCPEVCEVVTSDDGIETCQQRDGSDGWEGFGYGSQLEGDPQVRQHYIGWWGPNSQSPEDDEAIDRGEAWRFCFVYCGPTTNLDNTIEWLLTDVPEDATPDDDLDNDGNRSDIPNRINGDDQDDPGWSGTTTTAAGSAVGFSLVACLLPDGSCRDDMSDFDCLESDGEEQGEGSVCGAQACTADLDGNGAVDSADLAMLLGSWGPCTECVADFNNDDIINAADLAVLLGSWGDCLRSAVCGDGIVGEGEQCDPPDGVTCDEVCRLIVQECPFPDIRSIVSDSEFDPPHVQRNYDAVNKTLHLLGDLTFEDFFYSSFELLVPGMLERLETLDTCTGNPIDLAGITGVLQLIADMAGDFTPAEVVSAPVGEMDEVKAAIDELRTYGIAFPPMVSSDTDVVARMLSIEILTIEAGLLTYADMYFLPYDQLGEEQLAAVMQANQPDGVLDYQSIGLDGDLHAVISNDRCCKKEVCEPGLLDLDECHAEESKACYIPGSSDNCGICSVGSKDCS